MADVAIVGAGPAGASLAYLLAKAGLSVTLIERRRDFAREFRGEILMPSGIEALQQMGLGDAFGQVPHHTQREFTFYFNGRQVFTEALDPATFEQRLPIAISQPALLEFIVEQAGQFAGFHFERGVAVRQLQRASNRVTGITIRDDEGERNIDAQVVIGADGRNSVVRRQLQVPVSEMSPPMDIVWCKLPLPPNWRDLRAYVGRGHLLLAYHTWDESLQLGWVILKGQFAELRSAGAQAWVEEMANHVDAELGEHLRAHLDSLHHPFLLQSESDRVGHWSEPGALLIGDAAHTMSPVGGQGLNIALRDAIVATNHLVPALAGDIEHAVIDRALAAIERERLPEVVPIQEMQAQPPRLVLSRAWWGEPLRRLVAFALGQRSIRHRAATRLAPFPFGLTDVALQAPPQ